MSLRNDVEELRYMLTTVLVDPSKGKANNRIVDLLAKIAAGVDDVTGRDYDVGELGSTVGTHTTNIETNENDILELQGRVNAAGELEAVDQTVSAVVQDNAIAINRIVAALKAV